MPTQRPQLVNDEIYHVVLRAVGDAVIFNNNDDLYRGVFSLYEFNRTEPVEIWLRRLQRKKEKVLGDPIPQYLEKRDKIVEVLTFCFMPNHIHLLLRQLKDGGISKFMQKVGAGYAGYFNNKNKRKGHLFNRFQSIHIKTNEQLQNVFVYCHTNPLSLIEPGWKENGIENPDKAIKFLEEEYRWSSYFDFLGKKNFPSVIDEDFLLQIMGGKSGCKEAVRNWIIYKKEMKDLGDIVIE